MSFDIGSALLGALAAGLVQVLIAYFDRRRETESVVVSIASEVDSICRLIKHQRYYEAMSTVASDIESGTWSGVSYVIDIRANYFTVFEGLIPKLGLLKPHEALKVVNFYSYCKSVIDSTRPDGPHGAEPSSTESGTNMASVAALLKSILNLGVEITQFPRKPIIIEHQFNDNQSV